MAWTSLAGKNRIKTVNNVLNCMSVQSWASQWLSNISTEFVQENKNDTAIYPSLTLETLNQEDSTYKRDAVVAAF